MLARSFLVGEKGDGSIVGRAAGATAWPKPTAGDGSKSARVAGWVRALDPRRASGEGGMSSSAPLHPGRAASELEPAPASHDGIPKALDSPEKPPEARFRFPGLGAGASGGRRLAPSSPKGDLPRLDRRGRARASGSPPLPLAAEPLNNAGEPPVGMTGMSSIDLARRLGRRPPLLLASSRNVTASGATCGTASNDCLRLILIPRGPLPPTEGTWGGVGGRDLESGASCTAGEPEPGRDAGTDWLMASRGAFRARGELVSCLTNSVTCLTSKHLVFPQPAAVAERAPSAYT